MIRNISKAVAVVLVMFVLWSIPNLTSGKSIIDSGIDGASSLVKSLKNTNINNLRDKLKGLIIVDKNDEEKNQIYEEELKQYILDMLRNIEGIQVISGPRRIEIIKPIQKIPVKDDFQLGDIKPNNNLIVNDPGYKYEWDISYTEADKAWSLIKQKREIKVAVLDTGIDYTHPDLKNKVLSKMGYNFVDNNSNVLDDNGHGTHVSGIIAASANNGIGVCGITGTLDVKIIPIKVLDSNGNGELNDIVRGIRYAADNGADVINLSFGTNEKSKLIAEAIRYAKSKGAFVVAAAGNDDASSDSVTPASDGAFAVSAMNYNYKKAYFSDYGNCIKLSAPGVQILSTVPGGYGAWDGTSMAAPVVTGIAAMVKAEAPNLSPNEIEEILDSTAKDIMSKGKDEQSGYGLIDAYSAIKKVKQLEK